MSQIIRAVKTDIKLGSEVLDAYKLENYRFEKRLGITGISQVLGYSKEWLGRLPKRSGKQFNALQQEGFTGCQIEVRVPHLVGSGASIAKTLSIRDFTKLVAYEALKKKRTRAIILLVAFAEAGVERLVENAFSGVSLDWFAEKIVHYSQWSYEDLVEALGYNYDDLRELYFGYDPPSLEL